MSLSPKQEVFCQCIVSGMSGKDSYLKAYETNCNNQVAYNEASKLLLSPAIQERIKEIRKPLEEAAQIKALSARDEQINFIKSRIEHCTKKEDEASLIRWNDQLNKIYSLYGKEEEKENTDNNLSSLDTNILTKIAKIG